MILCLRTPSRFFTVYNNSFEHRFEGDIIEKARMMDIDDEMLSELKTADFEGFIRIGSTYADAVVRAEEETSESLNAILTDFPEHKFDTVDDEDVTDRYFNLYTQLLG